MAFKMTIIFLMQVNSNIRVNWSLARIILRTFPAGYVSDKGQQ